MPVVVFQGLLGAQENESVIREVEAMRLVGDHSSILKAFINEDTFESAVLGHAGLQIPQGPLTVAALGWDPPERSTHFHLSVLSSDGDAVSTDAAPPTLDEYRILERELIRLNTKAMTLLPGEGVDHGMVWERRVDMLTHEPSEAVEMGLKAALPEGDLENDLRRLIDDSVNILSEQEFNLRRLGQGQKPLNLVWPWGQGERRSVPNLALRLGYPWRVYSSSLAIRGYARLSGLRTEKLPELDLLTGKALANLIQNLKTEPRSLAVVDFSGMEGEEHMEEKAYKTDVFGRQLVMPLMDWHQDTKQPLIFVATKPNGDALIAEVQGKPFERDAFPFDERVFEDRQVGQSSLTTLLEHATMA